MSRRKITHEMTVDSIGGPITLADLRWLVNETQNCNPASLVTVEKVTGDQRDPGYSTITVEGQL